MPDAASMKSTDLIYDECGSVIGAAAPLTDGDGSAPTASAPAVPLFPERRVNCHLLPTSNSAPVCGAVTPSVRGAIATHKAAVMADEANFDDDGNALDEAAAAESMKAEVAAYRSFVNVSCHSWEDVQAKVHYLLNGSVGMRTPLLDCLYYEEYEPNGYDLAEAFLRSLVLATGQPAQNCADLPAVDGAP